MPSPLRRLAAAAVIALAGAACAGPAPAADGPPAPTATVTPTAVPATSAPGTTTPPAPPVRPVLAPDAFAGADTALERQVAAAGLRGGAAVVVRDGTVVHEHLVGGVGRSTPLSVASAAKWLTAATLLTFVDDGTLNLDDPVGRWLPALSNEPGPPTTLRQLLTHTSGVRDQQCLWSTGDRLDRCVDRLVAAPRQFPPGTAFSYGNAGYHVAGRVIETVGGADFATVFRQRLGDPLGLTGTTWSGAPDNPSPAAGVRTTVDDYLRFLAVLGTGGWHEGRRLLSAAAVGELTRDQVTAYDKTGDEAVGITGIPRYALGAWPDEIDSAGATVVVSGNGARGFYPWVDRSAGTWGVLGVQDDRGATVAVPGAQAVARRYWQAARG